MSGVAGTALRSVLQVPVGSAPPPDRAEATQAAEAAAEPEEAPPADTQFTLAPEPAKHAGLLHI